MTLSKATTGRVPSNVDGIFGPSQEWLDAHNAANGFVDPVVPPLPEVHREPLGSITTFDQYEEACAAGLGSSEDARLWRLYGGPVGGVSNVRPDTPEWVFQHFGKGLDDVETAAASPKVKGSYLTYDQLKEMKPPSMLIEGLLPQKSLGYITGRDGTYKTFLALDVAMHLLTDRPEWHGREIDYEGYGRVLFIAGEGATSFGKRIGAWEQHHGISELLPHQKKRLLVRDAAVDLYTGGEEYEELASIVKEWQPDLIVVDTLRRSSGRAEANSATEMGVVTDRIEQLKRLSGGTVIVIAHTDKGDNDARGSSSIEDDADFVLHCKRDDDRRLRVKVAKLKDGEDKGEIVLRAVAVADSLVLADKAPEPVWSSSSLDNRIVGVLRRQAASQGVQQKRAQIEEGLAGDRGHDPVSKSTLNYELAKMVEAGRLVMEKKGVTPYYTLVEGWTAPESAPTTYVPEEG